jgi:hypothetical protein
MGKRKEPRKEVQVPVRIFGTDRDGAVFSQKVVTVNVSRSGVELAAVQAHLALDEIIGLTYGSNRVHFRVKWVAQPGTPKAGHVGLLSISPEKPLWDFPLPAGSSDAYQPAQAERRRHPRFRCQNSVEMHVHNGPSFWGTVADLSVGGCYVEMPLPLDLGTRVKIGIWFDQGKAWAEAEVAHSTPGFGVGIRFTEISEQNLELIRLFLGKLSPFSRKAGISKTT